MDYPRILRKIMAARNWTQTELAEMLGVTQPTISRWLKGAQPDVVQHHRIADMAAESSLPREEAMDPGQIIAEARKGRGWSRTELARHSGVSDNVIQKIEEGDTKHSKFLPRIAKELSLDIATLDIGLASAQADEDPIPERKLLAPGRDLPVHASAEGGPGQIIVSSDPVDFMARPVPLLNTSGAYGLLVVGTSMEPEYRQGDTALVNPNLPVIGGEVYIFYAEREGEARATIKHLRKTSGDTWFVLQHNPPDGDVREFTLTRREWQWAHRVIGKYSRI